MFRRAPDDQRRDPYRMVFVVVSAVIILTILIVTIIVIPLSSSSYNIDGSHTRAHYLFNETIKLLHQCEYVADFTWENFIFSLGALLLCAVFSCSVKRVENCPKVCGGRPGSMPHCSLSQFDF